MKKQLIFPILTLLVSIFSCAKDNEPDDALQGTWKLVQITGGITGRGYTASFDNIKFTKGSNYYLLKDASVLFQGKYSIVGAAAKPDSLLLRTPAALGDFFSSQENKKITLSSTKLLLDDPCCDLYNYEFSKSEN